MNKYGSFTVYMSSVRENTLGSAYDEGRYNPLITLHNKTIVGYDTQTETRDWSSREGLLGSFSLLHPSKPFSDPESI